VPAGGGRRAAHLVATGDGWKTSTSMPRWRTSTARLAPNVLRKLLVAAYSAVKGDAMAAAALDVNTMQPRWRLATCARGRGWTRARALVAGLIPTLHLSQPLLKQAARTPVALLYAQDSPLLSARHGRHCAKLQGRTMRVRKWCVMATAHTALHSRLAICCCSGLARPAAGT